MKNRKSHKSLAARCSQRTSTLSDADVIIFSDDVALGNDTKCIADIAKALHSGKIVGYANPSGQAFKQFAENIRTASENLLKDNDFHTIVDCYFFQHLDDAMGSNLPNDTPNAFARLVAICSEGIFVMGSPEDATVHATTPRLTLILLQRPLTILSVQMTYTRTPRAA